MSRDKASYNGWKTVNNVSEPDQLADNELVESVDFHAMDNGSQTTRLGYAVDSLIDMAWYQEITSASTSGWALSTDGANLGTNTDYYVVEETSLEFDKTGTSEALVYAEYTGTLDLSYYEAIEFFTRPTADVTSYTICVYTDANNYYYNTIALDVDTYGWQQIRFQFNNASTTGSPALSSITSIRIQYNFADAADTATDIILNTIYGVYLSNIYKADVFKKSTGEVYVYAITDGCFWVRRNSASYNGKYIYDPIYDGFMVGGRVSTDTYKDILWIACEGSDMQKFDGSTVTSVGVELPPAPSFNSFISGGNIIGDCYYAIAYHSTEFGHTSAYGGITDVITPDGEMVVLNLPGTSPSPQYDKIWIYRRHQATGGDLYWVGETDVFNVTYTDNVSVEETSGLDIAMNEANYPPPTGAYAIRFFKDRAIITGHTTGYNFSMNSDPQSYSPANAMTLTTELSDYPIGISPPLPGEDQCLMFTRNTTWLITYIGGQGKSTYVTTANGTIDQPYQSLLVSSMVGCVAHSTIQKTPIGIMWLGENGVYSYDSSNGIQLRSPFQGNFVKDGGRGWFGEINKQYMHKAYAEVYDRYYRIAIPQYPSTKNNILLEYNTAIDGWREHSLGLDVMFSLEDADGYPVFYHSAEKGKITYESGYTDNGATIAPHFKTKAYHWNTSITGRRLDVRNIVTEDTIVFKQYLDLSEDPYEFPSGTTEKTAVMTSPITRIPTTGKCKYVQHEFIVYPTTKQINITGYNFEFDIRYNE